MSQSQRPSIPLGKTGPDVFRQFADRFRNDPAWRFQAMDASHSPNVTAPDALAALLLALDCPAPVASADRMAR